MLDKPLLPHHKLHAFGVATELLVAVRDAGIRETHLRDQAMRAAQSACLNTAEGAARVTRADKAFEFGAAVGFDPRFGRLPPRAHSARGSPSQPPRKRDLEVAWFSPRPSER